MTIRHSESMNQTIRMHSPFEVPQINAITGVSLNPTETHLTVATFAMGCFWGVERLFWKVPGVYTTLVGYSGGEVAYPTYEEVCTGATGHAEVVKIYFDAAKVSYESLLKLFWENHNPTQGMRQGNDIGSQYRSMILCHTETQMMHALASKTAYQEALLMANHLEAITTEILYASNFYIAEPYHQQYLFKNPNGYCGLGGTGVCML